MYERLDWSAGTYKDIKNQWISFKKNENQLISMKRQSERENERYYDLCLCKAVFSDYKKMYTWI